MEFKEYLAIIRRRWLLFFPIFALIVGAHLFWVTYGQTSKYSASSKVIIGADKQLPLQALPGVPIGLHGVSYETKEATLTDYPVLRRAAELALGRKDFESGEFDSDKMREQIASGVKALCLRFGNTDGGLERVIVELEKSVQTKRQNNEQIVEILAEGDSKDETIVLSWAMAEGAAQFHNEKARGEIDAFLAANDTRIEQARADVQVAAEELHIAQKELGITNYEEKENQILAGLRHVEEEEARVVAASRKNDRLIQYRLQEQSFDGRSDAYSEVDLSREASVGAVQKMLFESKLELEAKVAALSPKHPDVHQLRAKIAGLEKSLAKEQDVVLANKYQAISRETNGLIKANALLNLELDVLAERRARLNQELQEFNALRQDFRPKEERYAEAQERLASLLDLRKQVGWFSEGNLGSLVVYDPAVIVTKISLGGQGLGPLTLTLLMAFIFALGVVYIVEYVDTRVKTEHDIRRHLNLPLLGIIPKQSGSGCLLTQAPPQSEIAEKFNTAATLIQSISHELKIKTLMVCSAIAREGKTTVSVNLAVALARKGAKVVLVDADLRISQIHNLLRLPNHIGLSTILESRVDASQVIRGVMTDDEIAGSRPSAMARVQRSGVENLDVITSGPPCSDPVTLLESGRLARLVAELRQHYDFVVFDTPPINKVGDALTISSAVDGSIFVVGSGQAEQHDVTWAKHLLTNVQSNILGVFLNKFAKQRGSEYYYYYYENDRKRKRVKTRG
ncbi:MAG: polysaccharide biosynthesis tyrosine autokinase [Planctomycetes bacterium]|nr:polysaccharide biosynthesis tyrosine autokinase [Planctomycetota bacterium]